MPRILFVCQANRFRSPLAMAYWRKLAREAGEEEMWEVESAGVAAVAGLPPLPLAVEVARAWGVDLTGHRSRRVRAAHVYRADRVLVMAQSQRDVLLVRYPWAREKVVLLTQAAGEVPEDLPDITGDEREDRRLAYTLAEILDKVWRRWAQRETGRNP